MAELHSSPRQKPPNDQLHKLLDPLLKTDRDLFRPDPSPDLPDVDITLEFDLDWLPWWWPQNRPEDAGEPWSQQERRDVLLRNLREQLGPGFPASPTTFSEKRRVVGALRWIYYVLSSGEVDILSSS